MPHRGAPAAPVTVRAFAPGRVNLIGDHVDYVGGLVLPMAVQLGTTVEFGAGGDILEMRSTSRPEVASISLPIPDPATVEPEWARFIAGAAVEIGLATGGHGVVSTTLPIGSGMSSSAALTVAAALAFGATFEDPVAGAHLVRRAEALASGFESGLMDQLAILGAEEGTACLLDCRDESIVRLRLPEGLAVHAVHCGVERRLAGSEYAARRRSCEEAEVRIGPLRDAGLDDVDRIGDPDLRRRARHVVTEIERVRNAAEALESGDVEALGEAMIASHRSLRDDYDVSIPELDELQQRLCAIDGVHGARLTGAGFGGCVVAVADDDVPDHVIGGWRLRPGGPARLISSL
ncbi:MAG: hypothetical protein OSA99_03585 [Acidimicrobiales bacterium]|nr:hypothetical protein [Acidimicrobiales bacterium]